MCCKSLHKSSRRTEWGNSTIIIPTHPIILMIICYYIILTGYNDARILRTPPHCFVCCIRYSEDMWWPLIDLPTLVLVYIILSVDVHGTVGVDGHHHLPDVRVDLTLLKPTNTKGHHHDQQKKNSQLPRLCGEAQLDMIVKMYASSI